MLSKMVIKKTTLKGNKKVPAGFYVLNIPLIIIKREKNIYLKSTLAQKSKPRQSTKQILKSIRLYGV